MSDLQVQMRHEAAQQPVGTSAAGLLKQGADLLAELEAALIDQSHQWIAVAHCNSNLCSACIATAEKQRAKIVALFARIDSPNDTGGDAK